MKLCILPPTDMLLWVLFFIFCWRVPWHGRHIARWRRGQSEWRACTFGRPSLAAGWKELTLRLHIQHAFNGSLPKRPMVQRTRWKRPICSSLTIFGYAPPPPPHSLAISDLLFYSNFNPKLFCNKHQMFSTHQNDFYGLKRARHGGLGDTIIYIHLYLICKPMNNPVAFSVSLIYLSHPNTLGIIYKVAMVREELSLQKSGLVIDASKNGEGANGHLLLFSWFAENGLLCCDRAFAD